MAVPTVTTPRLYPADVVGRRYGILRELAHDERSATYMATAAGREVVLRILDPDQPELLSLVDRLRQVGEATGELPQDLVASSIVGSDPRLQAPFLATPVALWPSLADAKGPIPLQEIVALAAHLGRALDVLHGSGVAHLGLKPTNVFVSPSSERRVQLVDAGVPSPLRRATSPAWLAPEQLDDGDAGDAASDLFVSALLLFHALTGHPLLHSTEAAAIVEELASDPRASERARELGVDLPAALDATFRRALSRDPAGRHARASDFAAELADALGVPLPAADVLTDPQPFPPTPTDPIPGMGSPPSSSDVGEDTVVGGVRPPSDAGDPRPTPGLVSLVSLAVPPTVGDGAPAPEEDDEPVPASGRLPLERVAYDRKLVAPPSKLDELARSIAPGPPRRTMIIAGVVCLFLFLLGVVAPLILVFHRRRLVAPARPVTSVASVESPSRATAPSEPPPSEPPPPEPPPPEPAISAIASSTPPPTVAPLKLRPGEGELAVECEPACEDIAIDGKITKRVSPFALRAGSHAIGVARKGYAGGWKKVDVRAGKRTELKFELIPAPPPPPK